MAQELGGQEGAGSLDIIWEAQGIAPLIGRTERQVAHMLASGALPGAEKIAGRWCISRRNLMAIFRNVLADAEVRR